MIIVNKKGLDKNEKQNFQSVWQHNNSYVHCVCYVDSCKLGKHQSTQQSNARRLQKLCKMEYVWSFWGVQCWVGTM